MKVGRLLLSLVMLQVLAGCVVPAPTTAITTVTFIFETFDTALHRATFPVDASYSMRDVYPLSPGPAQPTPYSYTISSKEHPTAKFGIEVTAHVVAPAGTLVTCRWSAKTPAGERSSERSRGGEGSAAVPAGGTEAIAYCKYEA